MSYLFSWRTDTFQRARLKLTLWYILVTAILLFIFSIAAVQAERRAFTRIEAALSNPVERPRLTTLLAQRLGDFDRNFRERLFLFDVILLAIAAGASYFLSGQTLAPIAEMLQEQEDFAADASHELRTPLTTIGMEIEALLRSDKQISPKFKQVFMSIQEEIKRLSGIVAGLLTIVRTENMGEVAATKLVYLDRVASEAYQQMRVLAKKRQITLFFHKSREVKVRGSAPQLKEVVLILLDNAIKYTPAGGKVTVEVGHEQNQAWLVVSDTGYGIPADDIRHIFERFYRLHRDTEVTHKGHGLGLSIAKKIIEVHKGRIKVKSTSGQGSSFIVILPQIS